ncbi:hypothetical protein GC088_01505 [Arthrobacter sp. JZ12]|uniref:cache domain-containing protein n=1 Tax=Arthrobacter sp. JZ12 TaxID=2654190 RepID=UPI002B4A6B49|nr:cache domain-containing protein [Arthrobacter sp. JZ12]WRH23922.1 hypothetical protein GC088_01505 [Arthrobacter sp. JZ12]
MTEWHLEAEADPHAEVSRFFQEILREVSSWTPVLSGLFRDPAQPPTTKAMNLAAKPLAEGIIAGRCWPVVGAGFVAAESVLADATRHMAWWQGSSMERLTLLAVAATSDAYTRREWFTRPMKSGRPHVTGPYVDFLCTDEYTMTMTVPVVAADRRVGVAGADVFVESLEPLLLPALERIHPSAALVNHSGRVIISSDAQVAAGTLLAPGAVDETADVSVLALQRPGLLAAARTVEPRGTRYAGQRLAVLTCGELPLAVVHPAEAS